MVHQVLQAKVLQEHQVLQEPLVLQVHQDKQELQAHQAHLVAQVHQVLQEMVHQVPPGLQVLVVHQVPQVLMV